MNRLLAAADFLDRRLFDRLTRRQRPLLDIVLRCLSQAANRSMLWLVIAGSLAAVGGRAGRRAALHGVIAISLTSTIVNGPLKFLARRERPGPDKNRRPLPIPLPVSSSFPSGHAASAFAFATGLGLEDRRLLVGVLPLAAGVAYSRVHLRVHYPLDVVAGAAIGVGAGVAAGAIMKSARKIRASRPKDREALNEPGNARRAWS